MLREELSMKGVFTMGWRCLNKVTKTGSGKRTGPGGEECEGKGLEGHGENSQREDTLSIPEKFPRFCLLVTGSC